MRIYRSRSRSAVPRDWRSSAPSGPWTPDVYVTVEADGTVRIVSHRCEMGQGVKTSLPSVVADEMEADWSRVVVEQATGDKKYGDQSTGGSLSIISFYQRMREAGASVRTMLERAAAQQWGVEAAECRAGNHRVVHEPSGRSADFAELVATAATLAVPPVELLRLKTPDQFRYIGKELQSVDLPDIIRGKAVYGADVRLPGMKYAAIARPPVVLGKVKSFNADKALAVADVEQVVELPAVEAPVMYKALGGVAVIANNSWAALKARDLLEIEWNNGPNADYESEAFKQLLLETVRQPGEAARDEGDFDAAAASAAPPKAIAAPVVSRGLAIPLVPRTESTQGPPALMTTRADTAALSALTCWQALVGDWRRRPPA